MMDNGDILVESYSDRINAILNEISEVSRPSIVYIDSAYRYARNRGNREIMADDVAFSIQSENLIILQKRITQEKKRSILTGIDEFIAFTDIAPSMNSPSSTTQMAQESI